MKLQTLLITASLVLGNMAWAGPGDATHKPMHGGVLATVKDVDYELVASVTALRLYVRDHGKAVDVSKSTAKLTLLTGSEKQEVELKPSGDKLEATGTYKVTAGTKVVAVISFGAKQATARFVIK
ncbi:hypothetical protein [Limnohabitans sp. Bal53]|jgi:hypothetical protein|uniref:hypothetical protein n=1 Tax=Limnohabitans sp. Bal53 TaxID=1977910 RepID=UPI000D33519B|nr:hypothetical protein [Limnohabitans sp. Bal53]MDP4733314.1 hypothetical protein [Limnohabitans sp.]PUE41645.1 hypothetical protein B9Z50_08140 [Limnohabitans sp. Bal53]